MRYKRYRIPQQNENRGNPVMAAALQYDSERDNAPRIVASGQRKVAEQILAEARRHNIPIYEDAALTTVLAGVNLGEEIPAELYQLVAEVLAYIYRVTNNHSQ